MQPKSSNHLCGALLLVTMCLTTMNSSAQQRVVVIDSTSDGRIKFANVIPDTSKLIGQNIKNDSKSFLKKVLKAGKNTDFNLYRVVTDELGMTYEKYQQTFNGINVEFSEYIVHRDKLGNIVSINGDFEKIADAFSISSSLKFDDAFSLFKQKNSGNSYSISPLSKVKSSKKDSVASGKSKVVIIKGYDNQLHLAYKVTLSENSILGKYWGYIDCATGDMIFKQSLIDYTNTPTTVQTVYSGSRQITTDSYTGGFRLRESSRGGTSIAIRTLNFNYAPYYQDEIGFGMENSSDFIDNDNSWTPAEHNTNNNNTAFDVHWGSEMVVDYFHSVFGRNSYDDAGGTVRNYVHVMAKRCNPHGSCTIFNLNNSLWDKDSLAMFYGDGNSDKPLVCLDIVAHEIGHGVSQTSVGNNTGFVNEKESGALNESLSDIWGACVEEWVRHDTTKTWLCAEDIVSGGARSMRDPKSKGQPNTYKAPVGNYWYNTEGCISTETNDNCGIHTNSGVGNYWFYLLAKGGTDKNDNGDTYNVTGIGIADAAKIVYSMLNGLLTPTSGYNDARFVSISVAINLFGANSCQEISVTNAWYAVGVGSPFQYHDLTITGPSTVCSSGATFKVNSVPITNSILWSPSTNLSPSSVSGNPATFTANGNGIGWVEPTLSTSCYSKTLNRFNVVVGNPTPSINAEQISGSGEPTTVRFTATAYTGATYGWYVNDVLKQTGIDNTFNWYFPCRVTKTIKCKLTNSCGTSAFSNSISATGECARILSYSVSPNPASSIITLTATNPNIVIDSAMVTYSSFDFVRVFDLQGNLKKSIKYSRVNSASINVTGWQVGTYIFEVGNGEYTEKHQVLIEK